MNWCVTWPLMDHLMGTRLVWVGTEKEADQWEATTKEQVEITVLKMELVQLKDANKANCKERQKYVHRERKKYPTKDRTT